jgi:DNA-binding response OmpR family regulator
MVTSAIAALCVVGQGGAAPKPSSLYDFTVKDIDGKQVVARIRARLRKVRSDANRAASVARFAGWTAYFDRYVLMDDSGAETPFSHAEGEVLRLFLESPKRLISRAQMQDMLGGAAGDSFDRAMDVRISRLRTKLGEDPKNPRLIKTIYGAGYIFLGDVTWG